MMNPQLGRLGSVSPSLLNGGSAKPTFRGDLVDFFTFKGKGNIDLDRNIIIGLLDNKLTAYNFVWNLMSGYGGYNENYNNFRQLSGTTGVFTNTDHSIQISNVNAVDIPVTEIPYKAGEISPEYQIKVTGLLEGQYCDIGYFYNYADNIKPPVQENLIHILKDGIYTIPSFTFPSDIKSGTGTRIVFNFAGDTDITIEQIPLYEGAIVTDGVDDYLKLDKVGYKVGTIIIRYDPIIIYGRWNTVFDCMRYIDANQNRIFLGYSTSINNVGTTLQGGNVGEYLVLKGSNNKIFNVTEPLYLGASYNTNNTPIEFLSMALYSIAIYSTALSEEDVQKEISEAFPKYEQLILNR